MRYILLVFVILISYGSLYPFRFSGDVLPTTEFFKWLTNLSYRTSKADILANILLFIPYGFVAFMTLSISRRKIYHASLLFLSGTLLAFILQYLQFYLPARVPSAADALYNSMGIIIGMLVAHLIKQYSHNHLSDELSVPLDWSQITIPLLLALIWICWRLFPYVPLFTKQSILAAVLPLINDPELNFPVIIRDTIGWLVFIYLLTRPPFNGLSRIRILKYIFYILSLEILIRGNLITINDLLSALCAFALFTSLPPDKLEKGLIRGLALAIFLTLIHPLSLAETNNNYILLPFSALMKGNPWANGELLLLKIYLYASFIYMLRKTFVNWSGAAMISISFLFSLSLLQLIMGDNNGEITEPLLAGLITWAISQVERAATDERDMAIL
jgi:VanZ family protein